MRLIVSSKSDPASQNIKEKLLDTHWECIDDWKGSPVYMKGKDILTTVNEHHIYVDNVDDEISSLLGVEVDLVVYISKHASKAGIHSLTVHPIGNFGIAKFGGKDDMLVPPAPGEMTYALRCLRKEAKKMGLDEYYQVSFEVTHHGPYLTTPTYYIEIGSDEGSWGDDRAGRAVASAVRKQGEHEPDDHNVVLGVGGGHYAPHFTDMVKEKKIALGHIVPGWALKDLTEEGLMLALKQSKTDTVCVDPGGVPSIFSKRLKKWCQNIGANIVEPSEL